ncbi:MAG: glycosyltransferase family A protein [Ilumatobacteraceae bacterium]
MSAVLSPAVTAATLSLLDELHPDSQAEQAVVLELSFAGPYLAAAVTAAGYDHLAPWASVVAAAGAATARIPGEGLPVPYTGDHADTIAAALDGRPVAAVVVVDLFAAGPGADPSWLLASLHTLLVQLGGPPLVVVEENPTHIDVVADLLTGRPRPGRVGRAGAPGVFGVGAAQLESTIAAEGFTPLQRRDVHSPRATPFQPGLHAAASSFTPLGQLLRRVRDGADEFGLVTDFVRAYAPTVRRVAPRELAAPSCFLSVIIRSQGGRGQHLLEALMCLAAQTDGDLEALVMVHDGDPGAIDRVEAVVDLFDDEFARRVRVIRVEGGQRGEPLARGLAAARGAYAAFLDDDDHVTGHWVEAFRAGAVAAPGSVIRSQCGEQHYRYVTAPHAVAEWEATSAFSVTFGSDWDFIEHLYSNRTPIHCFAVPLATVHQLGVTVDGSTPILEDWGLLLRMAELCGVRDTGEVTAIYQRWAADDRSHVVITPDVWAACRTLVLEHLAATPMVVPRGAALRLVDLVNPNRGTEAFHALSPATPTAAARATQPAAPPAAEEDEPQETELEWLRNTLEWQRGRTEKAETEAAQLAARVHQFEHSEWWRLTAPMRRGVDRLRRRGR